MVDMDRRCDFHKRHGKLVNIILMLFLAGCHLIDEDDKLTTLNKFLLVGQGPIWRAGAFWLSSPNQVRVCRKVTPPAQNTFIPSSFELLSNGSTLGVLSTCPYLAPCTRDTFISCS
jgi:hypothetical protein